MEKAQSNSVLLYDCFLTYCHSVLGLVFTQMGAWSLMTDCPYQLKVKQGSHSKKNVFAFLLSSFGKNLNHQLAPVIDENRVLAQQLPV